MLNMSVALFSASLLCVFLHSKLLEMSAIVPGFSEVGHFPFEEVVEFRLVKLKSFSTFLRHRF